MQFSPKLSLYLNGIIAAVAALIIAIGQGLIPPPPFMAPDQAKTMVEYCAYAALIINFFLHGISAPVAGPFVKKPADPAA